MKTKCPLILVAFLLSKTGAWGAMTQQAYLKASSIAPGANFGWTVSVSENTLVVGVPFENSSSGGAYVFVRDGTNWIEQAYLTASNAGPIDQFGVSVAVSGDTIVVGANREDSGDLQNESDDSAPDSGAAYAFVRDGTNWSQQAYLKASNIGAGDQFGWSVSVSGDTIAVGAKFEDSNATSQTNNSATDSGAAYVFARTGANWSQQAYLKASNTGFGDDFGWSVAVASNTVVVGAPFENSNSITNPADNSEPDSGATYVFARTGTNWNQQAYLKAFNPQQIDQFGVSVAISAETILVGANREDSADRHLPDDNSATDSGAAYVFVRNGTNWAQQAYLKTSNLASGDQAGWAVGISGDIAVVAAKVEDSNASGVNSGNLDDDRSTNSGAAYVFVRSGTNWNQQAYLKASNTGAGDQLGYSAAISGDTVAVGSPVEASWTGDPNDDSASGAGAAYVFTGFAPPPPLGIEPSAGNVRVYWPLTAAGFVLEAAPSLDGTVLTNWTDVSLPYQTNATQISVTFPQPTGDKFYRLRK